MICLIVLVVFFLLLKLSLLLYNHRQKLKHNENFPHGYSGFMKFWLTCLETFPENRVYCSYNCPTDWNDGFSDDSQFGKQLGSFELCYQDPNHRQLADFKDREGRYLCWKESQEMCIVSFSRGQPQKMRLCDLYENHALLDKLFKGVPTENRQAPFKYLFGNSRFLQIDRIMGTYVTLKNRFMRKLDEQHLDHPRSVCSGLPATVLDPDQFVKILREQSTQLCRPSREAGILSSIRVKIWSLLMSSSPILQRHFFGDYADQSLKTFFDELNPLYGAPLAIKTIKFIDDKLEFLPKLLSSNNSWCFDKYANILSVQLQDGLFEKFLENFELPDRVVNGYWIYKTVPARTRRNCKTESVYVHPNHVSTLQDSLPKSTAKFRANFVIDENTLEPYVMDSSTKSTFGGFVKQRTDKSLDHERVRHWQESTPKCAHNVFKSGNYHCIGCGEFVVIRIHEGVVYVECRRCGIGPLDKVYCFCESAAVTVSKNDEHVKDPSTEPAAAPNELMQRLAAFKRDYTYLSQQLEKLEKTSHFGDKTFREILSKLDLSTNDF